MMVVRIDVGGEKVQAGTTSITKSSCFCADDSRNVLDQLIIECSGQDDRHSERGGVRELTSGIVVDTRRASHTMKGFTPPLIRRQSDSWSPGAVTTSSQ